MGEDGPVEGTVEVAVVMGTMAAGRGFGCFASGPISEALLELPRLHGKGVWGTEYAWLITFVGVSVLLGRFGVFGGYRAKVDEKDAKGKDWWDEERTEGTQRSICG